MFQPFQRMYKKLIVGLYKAGKRYFVSQSYQRGQNLFEPGKHAILLSHYDDEGLAQIHYNAIPNNDPNRHLYDLKNAEDLKKLNELLAPESNYVGFSSLYAYTHDEIEKLLDTKYREHTARYIKYNTNWKLSKNTFNTQLEVIFGELYLEIKFNSQRVRTKFEKIENS